MAFPPFVTRAALRIALGGVVAAAAIAVAGLVVERTTLGGDLEASRARLRAEVEGEFTALADRLDRAVGSVALDSDTMGRAERGETAATRQLFDQVAAAVAATGVSVTIYGAAHQPVAWLGRSEDVDDEARLTGPPSLFLAQNSQGLQLVRVQPVFDSSNADRHVGTVVAEAQLADTNTDSLSGAEFSLDTSIVPVAMRRQFEGTTDAGPDTFVIRAANHEALAAVIVSDQDLTAARRRIRDRLYAAELGLAALLALLMAGPLLDWRRLTRSVRTATLVTLGIVLLVLAARAILWIAVRKAGLAEFSLLPSAPWSPSLELLFASPLDFLLSALVIAGLVVLAVSSFVQWRAARRPGIGVVAVDSTSLAGLFYVVQLAAGVTVTALVMAYEWLLRAHVSQAPVDIVRFALDRIDPIRLPVIVGLIVLNAAVVALAVLLFRLAWSPWIFPDGRPVSWRWRALGLWLLPSAIFFGVMAADDRAPQWPSLLVVIAAALGAWLTQRYAALNRHGSQALKLLLSFLAVALPSLILYPSLVDASERARRQLIESRYAPEVTNQRQDLHTKLQKALVEINRIVALDDLVRASDPPPAGPPPTDAAFMVWSQTSLATERLTSSVELHNAAGEMVSRFAMNLPDFTQPQPWSEPSCEWDTLEEVSPLFSEERRLLHAGRALCLPGGRRAGSIVVHSMLDYSNLSFISAQNPYVQLMRTAQRAEPKPGTNVNLYVYGWSRRVLYSSAEEAPPLSETAFRRAYETR
ncbi:MAG TPA: hypothetical protein VEA16_07310, partial [Vicinamibacterales bacterium]|nr:hypothetical protein [Vicinamibacterales bacterium]